MVLLAIVEDIFFKVCSHEVRCFTSEAIWPKMRRKKCTFSVRIFNPMELLYASGIGNWSTTSQVKSPGKHDDASGFLWNKLSHSKKSLKVEAVVKEISHASLRVHIYFQSNSLCTARDQIHEQSCHGSILGSS